MHKIESELMRQLFFFAVHRCRGNFSKPYYQYHEGKDDAASGNRHRLFVPYEFYG